MSSPLQEPVSGPDVAIVDAVITGNFIQAASGPEGRFLLPATLVTGKLSISGERYDLGVKGSVDVDVPSAGNTLRLASVPFRVMTILPAENTEVNLGQVFTVLLSAPADPAMLDKVKLLNGSTEISVRRSLSQDGRMLLVTPNAPLSTGTTYALVADGLTGIAGEVALTTTRTVHTIATPPPPNEAVDFSRIQLSYPDASFNVTITIPEGAIPALASLSLEAPLMGSAYSGQMPSSGDLTITFKANRGERLNITVQFASGRKVVGNLSRYESPDGRVTLSVDGGRINASDGSGAAVVIPAGALDEPAELKLTFTNDVSPDLDPALAAHKDKVAGRIQLMADHAVTFKLRPRIEIPAPANASIAQHSDGLGAYAVFDRVEGFEEDGTPAVYFEMGDTAAFDGTRLMSQGGLPEPTPDSPLRGMPQGTPLGTILNREMGPGRGYRIKMKNSIVKSMIAGGGPQADFWNDWFGALDSTFVDSGPHYLSGLVKIKVGAEDEKPAAGAYIFFAKDGTLKRTGQMLQLTSERGSYILASSLTEDLVRGGGQVMAVDKDWGIRGFSGTSFGWPTAGQGKYYYVPAIHLVVTAADQSDHIAPWAEIRFEGRDILSDEQARTLGGTEEIYFVVNAHDNRDAANVSIEMSVDGKRVEESAIQKTTAGLAAKFKSRLQNLIEGVHVVDAVVRDTSGNTTGLTRTLRVMDFRGAPPNDPDKAPTFTIQVDGGETAALPGTLVAVAFTEPVTGVQASTLLLEQQNSSGDWISVQSTWRCDQGDVVPTRALFKVYFIPTGRLDLGGLYRVRGTQDIRDQDSPPKALNQEPMKFRVTKLVPVATFPLPDTSVRRVAVLGGRTFVATGNRIYMARAGGATSAAPRLFGVPGSGGGGDFLGQEIVEMKVFRQVPVLGQPMDLLAVTTTPNTNAPYQHCALWVFNACSGLDMPNLLFGMSIGVGASGYTPSVDCLGGYLVLGRLIGSMGIVSVDKARTDWLAQQDISQVISPGGLNQRAMVQPFYLSNPDGSEFSHPGVALVPAQKDASGAEPDFLHVVVGDPTPGILRDGKPLRGLPSVLLNQRNGALVLEPPYVPLSGSSTPGLMEVDARAYPATPLPNGNSAQRVAVLRNIAVLDPDGTQRITNLALGFTRINLGHGGNSMVIMDEANPKSPVYMVSWPTENLGNAGAVRPYELPFVTPSVDNLTGLVALPVKFTDTGEIIWYVLDLKDPRQPKTVATIPTKSWWGSLNNGLFASAGAGGVVVVKVVDGVAGVDEGQCGPLELRVKVTFDKPLPIYPTGQRDLSKVIRYISSYSPIQAKARFIKIQMLNSGTGQVAQGDSGPLEGYTDGEGVISFPGIPYGDYKVRAIPDLKMSDGSRQLGSAGVYKSGNPSASEKFNLNHYSQQSQLDLAYTDTAIIHLAQGSISQTVPLKIPLGALDTQRFSGSFNILWNLSYTLEFLDKNATDGSGSPFAWPKVYVNWDPQDLLEEGSLFEENSAAGAAIPGMAYINGSARMNSDEFDDSVIVHEFGHLVSHRLHADQSTKGIHYLTREYDWTLTWSEGWASAFQAVVRSQMLEYLGLQSQLPSNIQVEFVVPPDYSDIWGRWPGLDDGTNKNTNGTALDLPPQVWIPYQIAHNSTYGLWSEEGNARALWWFTTQGLTAPKLFQALNGLADQQRLATIYTMFDRLVVQNPAISTALKSVLVDEQILSSSGVKLDSQNQPWGMQPWTIPNTSLQNVHISLSPSDSGNEKQSTVYFFYNSPDSNPKTLSVKTPAPVNGGVIFAQLWNGSKELTSNGVRGQPSGGTPTTWTFILHPEPGQPLLVSLRVVGGIFDIINVDIQ
ncbi:MAG: hypothetical protein IPP78_09950 [Holophagaceae bacterium]|nr:hypothetical protein [Holophagaceae bacterium]